MASPAPSRDNHQSNAPWRRGKVAIVPCFWPNRDGVFRAAPCPRKGATAEPGVGERGENALGPHSALMILIGLP